MNECPLCKIRVSDWMMVTGKTVFGNDAQTYHKFCVMDFELQHGQVHPAIGHTLLVQKDGLGVAGGWSLGSTDRRS